MSDITVSVNAGLPVLKTCSALLPDSTKVMQVEVQFEIGYCVQIQTIKRTGDGSAYFEYVEVIVVDQSSKDRRWSYRLKALTDAAGLREAGEWFSEDLLFDA
jgi:hypothetical protein